MINKKLIAAAAIIFAIVYLILPTDLILDIIPVVGWMDDAVVIIAAILFFYNRI